MKPVPTVLGWLQLLHLEKLQAEVPGRKYLNFSPWNSCRFWPFLTIVSNQAEELFLIINNNDEEPISKRWWDED